MTRQITYETSSKFSQSVLRKFEMCKYRLGYLEQWRELAVRPEAADCVDTDKELLKDESDDLEELNRRCTIARNEMNNNLPPNIDPWGRNLQCRPSTIKEAGLGLFYEPKHSNTNIPKKEVLCYYSGHIHTFRSSKILRDKSYLMSLNGDVLVDPATLMHIKARYINDPLNDDFINCEYVPEAFRAAIVTTREIFPGEELFVAYGDAYWSQQTIVGTQKRKD
jgi:hypothetical protein